MKRAHTQKNVKKRKVLSSAPSANIDNFDSFHNLYLHLN